MSKGLRHLAPLDVTSAANPAARVGWVSRNDNAQREFEIANAKLERVSFRIVHFQFRIPLSEL
jgi:hypothetical protein